MEKKRTSSGVEFYLAVSVGDLLSSVNGLGNVAKIVLTNVLLRAIPEPEDHPYGGISQWYEVSDSSGKMDLYWPWVAWQSEVSGLTPEMRECGQFFAPALELEKRYSAGIQIIRIIKKQEPEAEKRHIRDWLVGFLPSWAGTHRRVSALKLGVRAIERLFVCKIWNFPPH